ncbi:ferrous iron transport protein B [Fimbriiglobus ruber]|uniref:Ferrous iron transport protein B n=1 Tax=Fimbriiglobus ruber TaxID=1908690 RepID=A0A225DHI9_9BACT|nr:ferrous iron transport protein B [Fimbriiglobus ruber]OWK39144.1 Ferrous iron transport protein B [Fimbriiglobus ruber]
MPPVTVKIALVGNPNAGKSTLFNALSGLRQHVGNYPGVTVEMKKGRFTDRDTEFELIDLPGTYSLAPRSPDEMVAVDLLLGRRPEEPRPDVILSVVDASNLDRHLYLTTQVMELGRPVVLAVNMIDVAKAQGIVIDAQALAKETGLRVVVIQANTGAGLDELRDALRVAAGAAAPAGGPKLPDAFSDEAAALGEKLGAATPEFLTRRAILDVGGYTEQWLVGTHGPSLTATLTATRGRLAAAGCAVPGVEARARYGWVRAATARAVTKPTQRAVTWSDRIDRVLTNKVWGTLVFLVVMFLMFQAIFQIATPAKDLIDGGIDYVVGAIESHVTPGPARSLLTDGVLRGVGSVIAFLPQIMLLFAFIAILEDCGYMARAAFLMDRLMSKCGLSGKSFIPLLSSVACAVPGIMATRVIEHRRDRLATILVAPLMSCSARLPVYSLLIGAFLSSGFSRWVPGLAMFGLYMIGFTVAPLVALLLKRTLLRGAPPLFVMELPAYKRPSLYTVARRVHDSAWAFLKRAGTLILASMIIVWAFLYFPYKDAHGQRYETLIAEQKEKADEAKERIKEVTDAGRPVPDDLEQISTDAVREANRLNAEWKRGSYLGQAGRAMEPVFAPLGWDWRIGMAVLASFPAREVIVGTLGIIYEAGEVKDDEAEKTLQGAIHAEWNRDPAQGKYTIAIALSVLVFFALCCQCASTLAVIQRETRSWRWPAFTFVYMTVLAYVAAFATYQIARFITDHV